MRKAPGIPCCIWIGVLYSSAVGREPPIEFDRVIRPLLAGHCFECHGPDAAARQAELRLDLRESALTHRTRDGLVINPGHADDSAIMRRLRSTVPDVRMPPPAAKHDLTQAEIDLVRRWIDGGATWQSHWAFDAPQRPIPPETQSAWPRNAIDRFVLARLADAGLRPSPEADRRTMVRRLTLDLTGLPPSPAEIDAFLHDEAPGAYERVVDRLFDSPHYGERMAVRWLDLARYADTNGYSIDGGRHMWAWRDWVIDAYNDNMPFDRFTLEQLAGDLLRNATTSQRVASGFNRNHMNTHEGGTIAEEYRVAYVVDRVNTSAQTWMGLTLKCAQCHDHKYDPVSQEEYYRVFAYFNTITDRGNDGNAGVNSVPYLPLYTAEQESEMETLRSVIGTLHAQGSGPMERRNAWEDAHRQWRLGRAETRLAVLEAAPVTTVMVMEEMATPRATHILVRGQYDQPAVPVQVGTPACLSPLPPDAPANRLGFAQWLVDPAHPLTARVAVNGFWQMLFGTGLVRTAEDFGIRGERPSHPDLLDWLAVEFMANNWDTKALMRTIVTSATYRQDSRIPPTLLGRDPANRLLARGPRFRLDAEFVRDVALAASGLLVETIGGPSARPYQPAGLWEEMSHFGSTPATEQVYRTDTGDMLYRRSLYTIWKRTVPPPPMLAFDAPSRETCTVRRSRTNTPLQALVLLNETGFVEAARALAERMMRDGGDTAEMRLRHGFLLVTAREPVADEVAVLAGAFERERRRFAQDAEAAKELLAVGAAPPDTSLDVAELAAWTVVANLLLNLSETVTRG